MGEDFKIGDRVVVENYPQFSEQEAALAQIGVMDTTTPEDVNGLTGTITDTGIHFQVAMDDPEEWVRRSGATLDEKHGYFNADELALVH